MHRRLVRLISFTGVTFLLILAFALPAAAHEQRTVGPYQIAFGWRVEPTYAGQLNGPEIFIAPANATPEPGADEVHASASDFAGVDINLQAEVSFGDQKITITFEPAGDPGHYIADLIPTLPGDYSFHLTGKIGDTPVDETFTSAVGQFSSVEPSSDVEFPSAQSLEARVSALEDRVTQLEAAVQQLQSK